MGVYEDVLMKRGSTSDGPQFVDKHHADVTKLGKTNYSDPKILQQQHPSCAYLLEPII